MPDAFDHCAALVRTADHDRFIATLFAPAERRGALYALYAFNAEVARVRDVAREPLPGEIRLQWWSEVVRGERAAEAQASPVAAALVQTMQRHGLAASALDSLIEAHRFDLYDEPMASVADLEAYAEQTASALFALAARIVAGVDAQAAARPAGIAYAVAGLLLALPLHTARRQVYVPHEILQRHGLALHDLFAGKSSDALRAALGEMRNLARRHLRATGEALATLPDAALPAFLPLAPVRPLLDRLERSPPFAPADLAPWRRQWLIWRAARNPARIAG